MRRHWLRGSAALFLVLSCGYLHPLHAQAPAPPRPAAPPDPASLEPTAAETMVLEFLNRSRANPQGDIEQYLQTEYWLEGVDREMLVNEMQLVPPCAPVFFHPSLMQSSRAHSAYILLHGMAHEETPGLEGFTGEMPWDRMEVAGFKGSTGENILVGDPDPWLVHSGFVIDRGEGPGGMQPGRPHRVCDFKPDYRIIGIGMVQGDDGWGVTFNFGGLDQRYVGGVIYEDHDGDEFYSVGEGAGPSPIVSGRQRLMSFRSGAYTLPVSAQGGQITVQVDGQSFTGTYPAGAANYKLDFVIPDLAAAVPGGKADEERLYFAVTRCEPAEAQALAQEMNAKYRRTVLSGWFTDSLKCVQMRSAYVQVATLVREGHRPGNSVLERRLRELVRLQGDLVTRQWRAYGEQVGTAFIALGQSGEIDDALMGTEPLPEAELAAGGE